ncbi:hypothetical protein AB9Q52_010970 [Pantoea vagans]|uniref:hypothetical protein n=1 Tax=Pantoea vagans TaxID=470934 RepID=UPI003512124E
MSIEHWVEIYWKEDNSGGCIRLGPHATKEHAERAAEIFLASDENKMVCMERVYFVTVDPDAVDEDDEPIQW